MNQLCAWTHLSRTLSQRSSGSTPWQPHWRTLEFANQGGAVAYGIVPTRPGLNAVDAATIFIRWLKAASLAGDPQKFAQRAMITATCGLGLLDTSAIAESFSVAHSVSKLIRSLAGSPELD